MHRTYKLNESETVEAMQLHGKGRKGTRILLGLTGTILLLLGIFGHYKLAPMLMFIGGLIGYLLVQLVIIPLKSKKLFRGYNALRQEITVSVTDQGISFSSESGDSRIKWGDIVKWKHNENVCLIYVTSTMFHMIPLRAFDNAGEQQNLFTLLEKNLGPQEN